MADPRAHRYRPADQDLGPAFTAGPRGSVGSGRHGRRGQLAIQIRTMPARSASASASCAAHGRHRPRSPASRRSVRDFASRSVERLARCSAKVMPRAASVVSASCPSAAESAPTISPITRSSCSARERGPEGLKRLVANAAARSDRSAGHGPSRQCRSDDGGKDDGVERDAEAPREQRDRPVGGKRAKRATLRQVLHAKPPKATCGSAGRKGRGRACRSAAVSSRSAKGDRRLAHLDVIRGGAPECSRWMSLTRWSTAGFSSIDARRPLSSASAPRSCGGPGRPPAHWPIRRAPAAAGRRAHRSPPSSGTRRVTASHLTRISARDGSSSAGGQRDDLDADGGRGCETRAARGELRRRHRSSASQTFSTGSTGARAPRAPRSRMSVLLRRRFGRSGTARRTLASAAIAA